MTRRYYIETRDGEFRLFKENLLNRLLGTVPKPKDGVITLQERVYALDPARYRRMRIKKFPFGRRWAQVQIWKENNPDPVDFFDAPSREDDMTGDIMAQLSRSKRLSRLIQPEMDWKTIIMAFLIGLLGGALVVFVYRGS